jgi:hypothetical protein
VIAEVSPPIRPDKAGGDEAYPLVVHLEEEKIRNLLEM